jgi:DNA-binding MarR family transcriptional regulator
MLDLFAPTYADLPAGLCRSLLKAPAAGGLTLREAIIMHCVLVAPEPPTVGDIARLIHAPQPSVTRSVNRLAELGFVRRQARAAYNRRGLVPTLKGQELLQ